MNQLQQHFSGILRTREQLIEEIMKDSGKYHLYFKWTKAEQDNFLDICTGAKGMRILSDSFFKEVMNPEYSGTRLESLLSELLHKKVKIVQILPNDSTRIADEVALLITDIVVELEDGCLANVEIQKIPFNFPAGRCACYSSDLMLRQYKRVRERMSSSSFSYRNIKNVYLIVIYEKSPIELLQMPEQYIHHAKQVFDTGLALDMLQEYVLISLDNFQKRMQNKSIETLTEAWLTFLGNDDPVRIMELISTYPEFEAMYQTLYSVCLNTERVMAMFSEELHELDRNTIKYMIEEQQEELDALMKQLEEGRLELANTNAELADTKAEIASRNAELADKDAALADKDAIIAELQAELARLKG